VGNDPEAVKQLNLDILRQYAALKGGTHIRVVREEPGLFLTTVAEVYRCAPRPPATQDPSPEKKAPGGGVRQATDSE
jgi:hypothetical protein